ncbi:MAG: hypothetical protein ACRDZR_02290 [Acidimicrobiales bacterium]
MATRNFRVRIVEGPIASLATGAPFPAVADVEIFEAIERVVTLRLRVRDGRPVLIRLTVGPWPSSPTFTEMTERDAPELTATEIHALPVEELVTAAIRQVALTVAASTPAPHAYDGRAAADAAVESRRRRIMTDTTLRQVAEIARRASAKPDAVAAIRREMHTSARSAYRWLGLAEERGYIPPPTEEDT